MSLSSFGTASFITTFTTFLQSSKLWSTRHQRYDLEDREARLTGSIQAYEERGKGISRTKGLPAHSFSNTVLDDVAKAAVRLGFSYQMKSTGQR